MMNRLKLHQQMWSDQHICHGPATAPAVDWSFTHRRDFPLVSYVPLTVGKPFISNQFCGGFNRGEHCHCHQDCPLQMSDV